MAVGEAPPDEPNALDRWLAGWRRRLPERDAGGTMLNYLWDCVDRNSEMLCRDEAWFRVGRTLQPVPPQTAIIGP